MPEVPRDRRRRRAGRAEPGEHRRQRTGRLPGRLAARAGQGRQGELSRDHRRPPNDGRVVTGIKVRQTDTELVLRDAEDREVAIPLVVDRRAEAGRLADARRPDRPADPRRAGRPRPVPLRAGQDRPLRGEQGAGHPPLAGAGDEPGGRPGAAADEPGRGDRRAEPGLEPGVQHGRGRLAARRDSRCRPASRTSSSTCRRWASPAARSTSRPAGRSSCRSTAWRD